MADAKQAQGTGDKASYQASLDEIWLALPEVVRTAGLDVVEVDRQKNRLLAQRGVTAFSWGENVAIFIETTGPKSTQVEVVTKKMVTTNIMAPNWSKPLFEQLDKRFKRVN